MAELRVAALAEVLKAGIDASKDISWQIRCGKTQDLAFARVGRGVRLTVVLSAKLEADPGLDGFRPRAAAVARCGTVAHASVGGLGDAAPARRRRAKTAFDRMEDEWDREDLDDDERELDEIERDLHRAPKDMAAEACRLLGITRDLSVFEPAPPGTPLSQRVGSPERLEEKRAALRALMEYAQKRREERAAREGTGAAPVAPLEPPDG